MLQTCLSQPWESHSDVVVAGEVGFEMHWNWFMPCTQMHHRQRYVQRFGSTKHHLPVNPSPAWCEPHDRWENTLGTTRSHMLQFELPATRWAGILSREISLWSPSRNRRQDMLLGSVSSWSTHSKNISFKTACMQTCYTHTQLASPQENQLYRVKGLDVVLEFNTVSKNHKRPVTESPSATQV